MSLLDLEGVVYLKDFLIEFSASCRIHRL